MTAPVSNADSGRTVRGVLGVILLIAGLCGHLFAARAIGGTFVAYRDHVSGFVILTVAAALIIIPVGRRLWRGRTDVTLLVLGALQAAIGFVIYLERFNIN